MAVTSNVVEKALEAAHVKSDPEETLQDREVVRGYDFDQGVDYHKLLTSFMNNGFQATHFAKAIKEVNAMIEKRKLPLAGISPYIDEHVKPKKNLSIFLGYTSNMTSCGVRDVIRFLVKHGMVDCLVTTAGGIEEDFIKCLAPTYVDEFHYKGAEARKHGLNRIGNLIAPNNGYCKFEEWLQPIMDKMLEEQNTTNKNWTPAKMVNLMGAEINHEESIYYWAYKNDIPVFCPAITDGAIGDNIFFYSYKNPGLRLDIVEDIRKINDLALNAKNTGMIILGGGLAKHHVCNANLMRNGADHAVFINTGMEFEGSDAGASPNEAVSWGKIKATANPVKVVGEASILFPLLVAETFARDYHEGTNNEQAIINGPN
eukprot:Seg1345.9 transcript_id=Seg1345.9/GoldUCD/mRNA.D3Y31 product="Deoxyhypusine synthase" protein_id=Seg1345.9/GoldUCD/D3Y31